MGHESSKVPLSLEDVSKQFDEWRSEGKKRKKIPDKLWELAVNLTEENPVSTIAKTLRLNHSDLKKRILSSTEKNILPPFEFIEIPPPHLHQTNCLIEMEKQNGSKIRMRFEGEFKFDLLEITQQFWKETI